MGFGHVNLGGDTRLAVRIHSGQVQSQRKPTGAQGRRQGEAAARCPPLRRAFRGRKGVGRGSACSSGRGAGYRQGSACSRLTSTRRPEGQMGPGGRAARISAGLSGMAGEARSPQVPLQSPSSPDRPWHPRPRHLSSSEDEARTDPARSPSRCLRAGLIPRREDGRAWRGLRAGATGLTGPDLS